jgi:glycosyltransferase involved in cell wall biosynthesis
MAEAAMLDSEDRQPLVSVVVTSYNHGAYIEETIWSIINQPYKNLELIIVDDGSSDDTAERVESMRMLCEQRFKRFLYLEKLNEGANRAANVGIWLARGEFVATLASDDKFIGDRVTESLRLMLDNDRCWVVYANGLYWDGVNFLSRVQGDDIQEILKKTPREILDYLQNNVSQIWVQTALFRRCLLSAVSGYDEKILADDWALNIRVFKYLVEHDLESRYCDQDVFAYRLHPSQSFRDPVRQFRRIVETVSHYTPMEKRDAFFGKILMMYRQQYIKEKNGILLEVNDVVEEAVEPVWQELRYGVDRPLKPGYLNIPRTDLLSMLAQVPKNILDVGCNTGATGEFIRKLYPGVRSVGIESNSESASVAKQHYDWLIQIPVEQVDWQEIEALIGKFDVILLADVLEHFYDPWSILEKLRSVVTEDAQVLVSLPNVRNLGLINRLAKGYWTYESAGLLDVTHIRFFTLREMRSMFMHCGFEIDEIRANWDGRIRGIERMGKEQVNIETDKIIIKNVNIEDGIEFAALQFLFRLRPSV